MGRLVAAALVLGALAPSAALSQTGGAARAQLASSAAAPAPATTPGPAPAPAPAPVPAPGVPQVPTVRIQPGGTAASVEFDATLEARRQSTVAAQVAGSVMQLSVKAGDRVRAAQVLARIDERVAQAAVIQSEGSLAQAEAQLRNARVQAERTRELRSQGFVSQAALDVAETQLKAAEAGVQQAQGGRTQAVLSRGFATVVAPFDAVVLATHVEAGDLAAAGRALVTLYAPGELRAVVQLPASRASVARAASQLQVELPDGRWVSPARRVDLPAADPVSQTVEWRLDLAATDTAGLLPGQAVRVRFTAAALPAAAPARPSVPASAVLRRGELTAVYVAQGQGFVLRPVRLGARQGDSWEVLAGLKAGESVALDAVKAGLAGAVVAP